MENSHPPGQDAAFRSLWARLRSYLRTRLTREDADDVLQTTFYKLLKTDELLRPTEWVAAWLFRVAKNEIIDLARKKKEVSFADYLSNAQHEFFEDALGVMLQTPETPEDEQLKILFWDEVKAALNALPAEQRFVFERTEFEGQSFKALSEETGIPQNTLLSRKRYAILRLRAQLEALRAAVHR